MTGEPRFTEAEWHNRDDLRKHWQTFCDADPFEGADTFTDRMEAAGFIHIRAVRRADLEESFAAERGGNLWELTKKGRAVIADGALVGKSG